MQGAKGEGKRTIMCQEIEDFVFGEGDVKPTPDERILAQKGKTKRRGLPEGSASYEPPESALLDESDIDDYTRAEEVAGVPIHFDRSRTQEQGISHPKVVSRNPLPTEADVERRRAGQEKADRRELVRQAGRRGAVFGFWDPQMVGDKRGRDGNGGFGGTENVEQTRRRVEIVQQGKVVEGSFAKGEWGVRWVE